MKTLTSANVKKNIEAIDRQENELEKNREMLMSSCVHKDRHNELDVVKKKNPTPNGAQHMCRCCKKDLNFKKISNDEMSQAIHIIDNAIDIIKLTLDLNREDDLKILKRYSKIQYRIRTEIAKLLQAAYNKNAQQGGDRRNRDRRNGGGVWGRATVNGR